MKWHLFVAASATYAKQQAALLYSKWLISCRFDFSSKSIDVTKLTYRFKRNVHGEL